MKSNFGKFFSTSLIVFSLVATGIATVKLKQNQAMQAIPASAAGLSNHGPGFIEINNALINGFPDFPTYPSAKIVSSGKEANAVDSQSGYSAKWKIGGDNEIHEVASWYITEMDKKGWKLEDTSQNSELEQIVNFTKNNQPIKLSIERGDTASRFTINILVDIPLKQ